MGDGGSSGDPQNYSQNTQSMLGKMLRIDVDNGNPYSIPSDNPFVGSINTLEEIWAIGLRNPWRFSFDKQTGDMWIGDVGQNAWEEINFQPADSLGGENYGWNIYEGTHQFAGGTVEDAVMPIAEYNHSLGCSVTGGYIYRGEAVPALEGVYLYSDYCSGRIWMAYRDANLDWQDSLLLESGLQVSSFGEDEQGELFVVAYSGDLYKLVAAE